MITLEKQILNLLDIAYLDQYSPEELKKTCINFTQNAIEDNFQLFEKHSEINKIMDSIIMNSLIQFSRILPLNIKLEDLQKELKPLYSGSQDVILQSLYDLTIQSFKKDSVENFLFPSMPKIIIKVNMDNLEINLHPMDIVRLINITKDEILNN